MVSILGRRGSERVEVALFGRAQTLHGTRSVTINDIARWGAMLEGIPPTIAPGCEMILKAPHLDVFATVRWVCGDRCGIRFDTPLHRAVVEALRSMSDKSAGAREVRLP